MKALTAALLIILLAGCAAPGTPKIDMVAPGTNGVGERMVVTLDQGWNEIDIPAVNAAARAALDIGPARLWTREGLPIDRLLVYGGVSDGEAIHPQPAKANAKSFVFRSSMEAHEIVALFEGMLTRDGSTFELLKLEPVGFGGGKGLRFEYAMVRKADNVPLSGLGFAAVNAGQLFALLYSAPRLGFFPRYQAEVERIALSASISGGDAPLPAAAPLASAPAPGTALASLPSQMPRPGDVWKYQYVDGFSGVRKQIFVHEVLAVRAGEIDERMYVAGQTAFADQQSFTWATNLAVVQRALPNTPLRAEFAPYLQAFLPATTGTLGRVTVRATGIGPSWDLTARVAGRETIVVPAGRFDAIRIELAGERPHRSQIREPVRIQYLVWYAPRVKRYVCYEMKSWNLYGSPIDTDRFELVEFKLN